MQLLGEADRPAAGPYRLVAELGRGGMGRVLLGVTPDGRLAAVKVVRSQFVEDDGFRARFRREVEASRKVSGAYTAAVVDADAHAPLPWLASVFVPGPPLSDVVRQAGPLPAGAARRLAAGLAAALAGIHRAGLIHRDLKPSNVLLAADGPRVIDFGIARATDSEGGTEITHTGWLVGSPAYMSPEQAEGHALTPASDVFSLGAVLVHACTGQAAFAGSSTPQTLYKVVHGEPDLTRLPDGLRDLTARCLAKDPEQRPTPAGILQALGRLAPSTRPWPPAVHALIDAQHAEITAILEPAGHDGPPPDSATAVLPTEPAPPDHDAPTADAPTADAPTPTAPTAPAPTSPPDTPAPGDAPPDAPPAGPPARAPGPGRANRPSRRTLLLGALGAGAAAAAVAVPLALDRDSGAPEAGGSPGHGGSASPTATASTSPSPSKKPGSGQTPAFSLSDKADTILSTAEISPDGKWIATGDASGTVKVRRVPGFELVDVFAGSGSLIDDFTGDLKFSPDGSLLAAVDGYATVTLWDVAARKKVGTLRGDENQRESGRDCLAFSRDGKTLAYGGNSTITLWDVAARKKKATLLDPVGHTVNVNVGIVESLAFTGEGRLIAATSTGKLRYWDVGGRRLTATLDGRKDGFTEVAVSRNSKVVAAAAQSDVVLFHTGSRKEIETVSISGQGIGAVAFSPDGKSLAAGEEGGAVRLWSTGDWHPVRDFDEDIGDEGRSLPCALSFSRNSHLMLLCLDYHLALWKLT